MTAAGTLARAIEKLQQLRDASTQWVIDPDDPEFVGWYLDSDGYGTYGVFALRDILAPGYPVTLSGKRADIELIVTLHRTIDAQLAILREGVRVIESWIDPESEAGWEPEDGPYPPSASVYLDLAAAILDEPVVAS